MFGEAWAGFLCLRTHAIHNERKWGLDWGVRIDTGTPFTMSGTDRLFCLQLLLNFLLISFLFILVPIIGIFGGAVVPLYKGMMSQTVDPDERGQFFLYYRASAYWQTPSFLYEKRPQGIKTLARDPCFLGLTNDVFFSLSPNCYCNRYFFCSVGAMFSAVTTVDTFCNFLGAFIFNPMYIRSSNFGFPGLPFLVSAVLIIIPLVMTK